MGSITTGIGLVSGINSAEIIESLMQLERRPIDNIEGRIQQTAAVRLAFTQLSTRLSALKTSGTALRKPSTFQQVNTASSDESVLTASATPNTAEGSYSFRVARLVQTQQVVSGGFRTADSSPVGAGTLSLELGNGRLEEQVSLDNLNGGDGVRRGVIEIVDRHRRMAQIDLSDAVTLDDVAATINAASQIDVVARIEDSRLVLEDFGNGTEPFRIRDVTGGTAEDLGILADDQADIITGKSVVGLTLDTSLSKLNGGSGVATAAGDGLRVTLADDTTLDVDLAGAETVADVIDRFNTAAAGKATLAVSGSGRSLTVADSTSGGAGTTSVTGLAGSTAAADLGLESSTTGGTLGGGALVAGYGSVLTSSLMGGQGLTEGDLEITNSAGVTTTVSLWGQGDVQELIQTVNAAGAGVKAQLNDAGNGIELIDTAGGTGPLVVANSGGEQVAEALGWLGSHAEGKVRGANLQRAWLTERSDLDGLNGGAGVNLGKMRITDSTGKQVTVDFTIGQYETVGDVLAEINRVTSGVTARVNDNGDGIVIEDTAGGAAALKVEDVSGSAAKDLRVAGEAAAGVIDGSYEVSIEIEADDSLEDVRNKINDLGFAGRAEVLNVGGDRPSRLSVVGRGSGAAGAFVLDTGATGLSMSTMSSARDAAVFVGGAGAESPMLVTSGSNVVADVVPGLTLNLQRVSRDPVTISIDRDVEAVVTEMTTFVESFNALRETIDENSKFNSDTGERGLLLGEPVVQKIERQVYGLTQRVYETGNPRYRILADIGITTASGAKLEFDEEKFMKAWGEDPEAVQAMFTQADTGFGYALQNQITTLTDPVDGLLKRATQTLERKTSGFEEQIARLEVLVASKRERLTREFSNLETALSSLQYQQDQLASIQSPNIQQQK